MTSRSKLLTAASAIAMALAVGSLQAAEPLTTDQLDTIAAGAAGQSSSFTTGGGTAMGGATASSGNVLATFAVGGTLVTSGCGGPCSFSSAGFP